jgi:signal transduction histidine kinase
LTEAICSQAIEQLLKETGRLSTLVANLLDLSRIESGREKLEHIPVKLDEVARDLLCCRRQQACAPITLDLPATLPAVAGDPAAIHRVLQNLLENACRFTDPEGSIRIWAEAGDAAVRFGITDTGCGIDPQELPRIWTALRAVRRCARRERRAAD